MRFFSMPEDLSRRRSWTLHPPEDVPGNNVGAELASIGVQPDRYGAYYVSPINSEELHDQITNILRLKVNAGNGVSISWMKNNGCEQAWSLALMAAGWCPMVHEAALAPPPFVQEQEFPEE